MKNRHTNRPNPTNRSSLWMFFRSGSAPKVSSTSTIQRSSLRAANLVNHPTYGVASGKLTAEANLKMASYSWFIVIVIVIVIVIAIVIVIVILYYIILYYIILYPIFTNLWRYFFRVISIYGGCPCIVSFVPPNFIIHLSNDGIFPYKKIYQFWGSPNAWKPPSHCMYWGFLK